MFALTYDEQLRKSSPINYFFEEKNASKSQLNSYLRPFILRVLWHVHDQDTQHKSKVLD